MMQVLEKGTEKFLGYLSDLQEVKNLGDKYRFEPFVFKFNFLVYKDEEGNFGVASPATCILREEVIMS